MGRISKRKGAAAQAAAPEAAPERGGLAAEAEWFRALDAADRQYMAATNGAYHRYAGAMEEDERANGPRFRSAGRDYALRYDRERAAALEAHLRAAGEADRRLQKALAREPF